MKGFTMTTEQARDRVIEAANEVTNQAKLMRAGLEAGNIAVAFDTRYRDSVTELIKECDALSRLESATQVSHPAPSDTFDAPADVNQISGILHSFAEARLHGQRKYAGPCDSEYEDARLHDLSHSLEDWLRFAADHLERARIGGTGTLDCRDHLIKAGGLILSAVWTQDIHGGREKLAPKPAPAVAWESFVEVLPRAEHEIWARFCGYDGIYRWLHPTENRWVDEPEQIGMPLFGSYQEAKAAIAKSPEPPTWKEYMESLPAPADDRPKQAVQSPPESDVCECGHGKDSHAPNQNKHNRCWYICKCTEYRPKQKGGE